MEKGKKMETMRKINLKFVILSGCWFIWQQISENYLVSTQNSLAKWLIFQYKQVRCKTVYNKSTEVHPLLLPFSPSTYSLIFFISPCSRSATFFQTKRFYELIENFQIFKDFVKELYYFHGVYYFSTHFRNFLSDQIPAKLIKLQEVYKDITIQIRNWPQTWVDSDISKQSS